MKSQLIQLKKEKNAVILAHFYQSPEVQQVADFVGDSLYLAQKAKETKADIIVFAGVYFMAETAKILNPEKKVLLPTLDAGCSLADSCPAEAFKKFKEAHPEHIVISYINCSAEIKSLSDIICTSGNAENIINSIPAERPIIFAPDKNLGRYLARKCQRSLLLWDGSCMVHAEFSSQHMQDLKRQHPTTKIIAHPECSGPVLETADFVGSTKALLDFVATDNASRYIVATEQGILYNMQQAFPQKDFLSAPVDQSCVACQQCPYMKMNNLQNLLECLQKETPEIQIEEDLALLALKPLNRMLSIGRS